MLLPEIVAPSARDDLVLLRPLWVGIPTASLARQKLPCNRTIFQRRNERTLCATCRPEQMQQAAFTEAGLIRSPRQRGAVSIAEW
jgi:hypothetical protein